MNITKHLLLLVMACSFWSCNTRSEDCPTSNRNYFKVLILNEKDEVLLVEFKEIWEFIGGTYNTSSSLEEYVQKLAGTANITVTDIRLRGLFSIYWNDGEKPDVQHYYTARYTSGDMQSPGDCTGAVWADLNKSRELIAYKDMLWMYETVLESETLWGGTYRIVKDREKGTREVEHLVDYFKLN